MKTNVHLWSYHSVPLRMKNVSEKCCRENQCAIGERSRRPFCVHRQLFYTTAETMKDAHPWPVYRPVHKSGCCEKNTHQAREVSSSNIGDKLIKNGIISSNFLSEISSHILQRSVNTISSNKTKRYSKYTVLTRDVWEATHTATDIKLIAYL